MAFLFNGAGEANTDAHLRLLSYPHDIIGFSSSLAVSNFDEFRQLYEKGLSLREISLATGFAKSTIRDQLLTHKVSLRTNKAVIEVDGKKLVRAFSGGIPYGFQLLDGKLVIDPKETKVVRRILKMYQGGMSFIGIAKALTQDKIPSKTGRKWNDKSVAAIIRRTKSE